MHRFALSELDGWICAMLQKPVYKFEAATNRVCGRDAIPHSCKRIYVRATLDKKLYVIPFVLLDKCMEKQCLAI